jgi:membrane carboxypeptidase/penicillin-binding protein
LHHPPFPVRGETNSGGLARGQVCRLLFGAIFTALTLGVLFAALSVGAVFYMYSRDLPSHESLAQYTPPTISRIYSGEGA